MYLKSVYLYVINMCAHSGALPIVPNTVQHNINGADWAPFQGRD